jgi:hypothetical protein
MALTPESTRALKAAIEGVVRDCGDDPKYKDLIGTLKDVESTVGGAEESKSKAPKRDGAGDDYSFETAQKRHTERVVAGINAAAGAGTDGGEGK